MAFVSAVSMVAPPAVSRVAPSAVSLYVGDLHWQVTDDDLYAAFSDFPTLSSVRVCRDHVTGRSLGYGYVNFYSPQYANLAIEMINHSVLFGKVIRVMRSNRDPIARKSGIGNVFVKNLDESVDNIKLQTLFKEYGSISSCKVVVSEDGKSKGFGFVQFENAAEANAAIENLHNTLFEGKQLYVAKFIRKSDRTSYGPDGKSTNLYFKNLDMDINEELLKEKFLKFGNIVSLLISKDENGNSKGFGFVSFDSSDDAKRAMESMNGSLLGTKILYVARAQKKAEREKLLRRHFEEIRKAKILKYQACNVYIKNIVEEVDDDELREHFSQYGTIKSAKLIRDEKGVSKGFGFVRYSATYEADRAVALLNGVMFRGKRLYVAIAQRKQDRLQQAGQRTILSGGYPPNYYYAYPPSIIPPATATQGLMYQPLDIWPGWSANGFADPTPFQTNHYPMSTDPGPSSNRGRGIGQFFPQVQFYANQGDGRARYGPNHRSHLPPQA